MFLQVIFYMISNSENVHNNFYIGYRVPFPGVKQWGRGVNHPLVSSTEVKERTDLYMYSPFGPLWPVARRIYNSVTCTSRMFLCLKQLQGNVISGLCNFAALTSHMVIWCCKSMTKWLVVNWIIRVYSFIFVYYATVCVCVCDTK